MAGELARVSNTACFVIPSDSPNDQRLGEGDHGLAEKKVVHHLHGRSHAVSADVVHRLAHAFEQGLRRCNIRVVAPDEEQELCLLSRAF